MITNGDPVLAAIDILAQQKELIECGCKPKIYFLPSEEYYPCPFHLKMFFEESEVSRLE